MSFYIIWLFSEVGIYFFQLGLFWGFILKHIAILYSILWLKSRYFVFTYFWFFFGPHLAVLWVYIWVCVQGSFLVGISRSYGLPVMETESATCKTSTLTALLLLWPSTSFLFLFCLFEPYLAVFGAYFSYFCIQVTPGGGWGTIYSTGIEPGLAACMTSPLHTVLYLSSPRYSI